MLFKFFFILATCLLFSFSVFAQDATKEPLETTALHKDCIAIKNPSKAQDCTQEKLEKILAKKIKYPQKALDAKVQGKVSLKVVFDEKGNVITSQLKVVKSPNQMLSDEVLRAAKELPQLQPARLKNGKTTRVSYVIPVEFKLP